MCARNALFLRMAIALVFLLGVSICDFAHGSLSYKSALTLQIVKIPLVGPGVGSAPTMCLVSIGGLILLLYGYELESILGR